MISLILSTIVRLSFPVLLVFSLHLLLRGHNEPGGGFIAGLMTAAAVVLQYIAHGSEYVRKGVPINYRTLLASGLALAGGTGLAALFYGSAFLEHRFFHARFPWLGEIELATALAFDVGVFCVVVGMTLMVISAVGEEE
jgi:monovalent cation:proton antiporter